MSELHNLICKNCGAQLDLSKTINSTVCCEYCKSVFTIPKKETSQASLSFLIQGEHDLDTGKFDDAYIAYKKASELDESEPEAYWGMALATAQVMYLNDVVNNRLQPICYSVSDKSFVEDKNFKLALKHATAEQKKEYEARGKEIDAIRKKFKEFMADGLNYDTFICVKVREENGKDFTQDSIYAGELYRELKKAGYSPFYSESECKGITGEDYEAMILYALHSATSMLLVCSDESYLQTKWVKNEYTRFLKMQRDEEKARGSLTVVFRGRPVERVPGLNGKIQGIDLTTFNALNLIIDFVQKFKRLEAPVIRRKEYNGVAYTKKNVQRQGVTKRQLTTVSGGEITVSVRAQMNLAAEFLARKDYANALRQCDTILSANPANSETHWMRFLAQHNSVNSDEYISAYSGQTDFNHFEKAIASASDSQSIHNMYDVLFNRVKARKDIYAYKEYIILPDSSESDIAKLTDIMYDYAIQNSDANIFREIIKTVTDTDKYISMNLAFAQKLPAQDAAEFYKNILSADEGHGEALYKVFAANHGFQDESVFKYCSNKQNFKDVEDKLFAYGFNGYATHTLFKLCLSNASTYPENSSNLLDFILAMIPKSQNETFSRIVLEYVEKMFESGNLTYAKKYTELLLSVDKLNHDAYFNRVMIKNGFTNPLELVKIADSLMDDSDFFSAVNSYTETNPQTKNLYLDINDAVKELSTILNTPRRCEQAFKNLRVDKVGLLKCKNDVLKIVEVADYSGTKFTAKEYIKTVLINIPTVILFVFALLVVGNPHFIFKNIHFGWVIGILIVGFIGLIVAAILSIRFSRNKSRYILAHIKQRSAIMLVGAVAYAIILSCGLVFAAEHTYSLTEAEDFKLFKNLPSADRCTYIIENDIDFDGKDYGMGCFYSFWGTIDGQGHTLSNIDYKYSNDYTHFGLVNHNYGTIKNLTIKDSIFHLGENDSGAVIAVTNYIQKNIQNCFVVDSIVDCAGKEITAIVCAKHYHK